MISAVKKLFRRSYSFVPVKVEILRKRPNYSNSRYEYQRKYVEFNIEPGSLVLDIGSGGFPFPYATFLADRFISPSQHRSSELVRDGKPLLIADISQLPFANKTFDYVYCSHLLEHVDDPILACSEIMRIGKRGYIETPTFAKDILFTWAKGMHKWYVIGINQHLCFFEYSQRQLEGIRSNVWRKLVFQKWYHPIQEVTYNNQDIFNVMFEWENNFSVFVFYLDGTFDQLSNGQKVQV